MILCTKKRKKQEYHPGGYKWLKQMKRNKIWGILGVLMVLSLCLQSCATGKKGCGCGNDINRMYQKKR